MSDEMQEVSESTVSPNGEKTILPAIRTRDLTGQPVGTRDLSLRDLARRHTRAALAEILNRMRKSKDEKIRLTAAIYLHNRGWGMPSMDVKVDSTIRDGAEDAPVVKRIKALADLANDPAYLSDVMRVLGNNGLLPGQEREADKVSAPAEVPKLIDEPVRVVEPEIVTDPEKMPPCFCGGLATDHPGLAGCEHCSQCNLYVRADDPNNARPK